MTGPRNIPNTELTYNEGSLVKYLARGREQIARVVGIYPTLEPSRWDGVVVQLGALAVTQDPYPDEGGIRVWAYESDILEVLEP